MASYTKQEQELLDYLDANFEVDQKEKTFKSIYITPEQAELYKTMVAKRYHADVYGDDNKKLQYRGLECLKVGYDGNKE